ncbi:MAG: SRPBCC domain-containing protein [Saprospiraceae bacterium]|nr:MAG: activator of HSP90 ATPase [Bacteroidetes bacterium OLB9]MCO6463784.1 SRPBCC domain-containing protein [Saprospiraceae bacterium]MCZ2338819.1 SRPBCC domain-containing protein [Chitinophagales bacterium]
MNNKITVTAMINADFKKVWEYYTDPIHIVNWNFADPSWHCPKAENNMSIGGTYKARMEAKDGSFGFDFEAVYTEIEDGKQFTYVFGGRSATVKLNSLEKGTEIIVAFDPETQNPLEMQQQGWQAILDNFKLYTENN